MCPGCRTRTSAAPSSTAHRLAYRRRAGRSTGVPRLGTGPGQRGGHRRAQSNAGQFHPVFRKPHASVDVPHHRLRRAPPRMTCWATSSGPSPPSTHANGRLDRQAPRAPRSTSPLDAPPARLRQRRSCVSTPHAPTPCSARTYMVVAPEHRAWCRSSWSIAAGLHRRRCDAPRLRRPPRETASDIERQENKEKTGVFTGVRSLTNPATNGARSPSGVADYVLDGLRHMAPSWPCPARDQRDWDFAEAFGLPIVRTVQPPDDFEGKAYVGEGPATNSGFLDGLRRRRRQGQGDRRGSSRTRGTARSQVNFKSPRLALQRASATGASRSRSSSMSRAESHHAPSRPMRRCPSRCPTFADYQPVESATTRPRCWPRRQDWVAIRPPSAARRGTICPPARPSGARPTPCPAGPAPAGTTCATATRRTTRR